MFFWIIAGLALLPALFLLVSPLFQSPKHKQQLSTEPMETVLSKRLDELKIEFDAKLIDEQFYEKSKLEAHETFNSFQSESTLTRKHQKYPLLASLLIIIVTVGSVSTYINYSNGYQAMLMMQEVDQVVNTKLDLIEELEDNLAENPDSASDWRLLARERKSLHQYTEATQAYQQLEQLDELSEIEDLRDYAESLLMSGQSSTKARQLLDRILLLNAEEYAALYLYGAAEFSDENYSAAIEKWQLLFNLMEDKQEQSEWRNEIQTMLAEARSRISNKQELAAPLVNVSVTLKSDLSDKMGSNDTMFVYMKAFKGPPMPLAVKKLSVNELGKKLVFSDADAMMQSLLPSTFTDIEIGAHISKSGNAKKQAGDLLGVSAAISLKQIPVTVELIIDQVVK